MKIIAIDFDETIHDTYHVPSGRKMGPPMPGAIQAFEELNFLGYQIVIFCVWADTSANKSTIAKWLDYFKFPEVFDITNIKPAADYFIDDRAIRFENNWPEIIAKIRKDPTDQ